MPVDPQPHRRTVLRGAAWTAPAIVLATAAPATAASGDAQVTTTVTPTNDAGGTLRVSMRFDSAGPASTGPTTVYVTCLPTPGTVEPTEPTSVSSGWLAGPVTATDTGDGQVFSFTSADGIRGIPGGVAATFLFFDVVVTPHPVLGSAGSITTQTVTTTGTVADGGAPWT
ncbi:hypothetical protein [Nocardioides sp.]|uniref:hypothetical protein n=1 Tax=Nocardioides sp. TaxID=35761 RepID=UPI002B2687E3|nr:hypothetical protein [Nocardioides sp.]